MLTISIHGQWGVFAIDAIAHGHDSTCFSNVLVQEVQWAYSLTSLPFALPPKCWPTGIH